MPRISRSVPYQFEQILSAWQHHRPQKPYSGLTLEQFRTALKPCLEVREEIRDLKRRLREAIIRRTRVDVVGRKVMRQIVNSVRGDPQDGPDCALYVAMGFVPDSSLGRRVSQGRRRANKARARAVR